MYVIALPPAAACTIPPSRAEGSIEAPFFCGGETSSQARPSGSAASGVAESVAKVCSSLTTVPVFVVPPSSKLYSASTVMWYVVPGVSSLICVAASVSPKPLPSSAGFAGASLQSAPASEHFEVPYRKRYLVFAPDGSMVARSSAEVEVRCAALGLLVAITGGAGFAGR